MKNYQREFIEFALETQALRLGEFKIKSGRISPYFFNAGFFNTGKAIARLGQFYAHAIIASGIEFDMLFGPAYKGIPLVASVAIALAEHHGIDKPFAFNRKEVKPHGEGGLLVGAPLQGKVLVVDDVISAGVTIGETVEVLRTTPCEMVGVVISLDRQERAHHGDLSAVAQVQEAYHVPVVNIIQLSDLIEHLESHGQYPEDLARIHAYNKVYGDGSKRTTEG
jgi:orotate phosphoribosyltransferase